MKKSQSLRGIKIVLQTTLIKAYEILVPDKIYRSELNSDKCPQGLIVFDLPPFQRQVKRESNLCELCVLSAAPQGGMQARAVRIIQ
jgi:hypothetical protein